MLIDEWQHHPPVWDRVRRAVDKHDPPGPFLLTGSGAPTGMGVHTGAGRIIALRIAPMASLSCRRRSSVNEAPAAAQPLPHELYAVRLQRGVMGDQGRPFDRGLSDQDPIERVAVMPWQLPHGRSVLE